MIFFAFNMDVVLSFKVFNTFDFIFIFIVQLI